MEYYDAKKEWCPDNTEGSPKYKSLTENLEKAVTPHSSALAWRIPGRGKPGALPSMGSYRVGHD